MWEPFDLGPGHTARWVSGFAESYTNVDDRFRDFGGDPQRILVGIIETHEGPDGVQCEGFLAFVSTTFDIVKGREPWQVETLDPLTVVQSFVCKRCGRHGSIREGQWIDA